MVPDFAALAGFGLGAPLPSLAFAGFDFPDLSVFAFFGDRAPILALAVAGGRIPGQPVIAASEKGAGYFWHAFPLDVVPFFSFRADSFGIEIHFFDAFALVVVLFSDWAFILANDFFFDFTGFFEAELSHAAVFFAEFGLWVPYLLFRAFFLNVDGVHAL